MSDSSETLLGSFRAIMAPSHRLHAPVFGHRSFLAAFAASFGVVLTIGCGGGDVDGESTQEDTWTEEFVSPDATQVLGVWVSAADDVWAADIQGLFHFDGAGWSQVEERDGSFRAIRDFWGLAADDLYAVRGSALFHWDGDAWTQELLNDIAGTNESLGLNAVWASSAADIWVADTLEDDLWHFDGSWTHHSLGMGYIYDLWGSGPNDVWAVTETAVYHWDGSDWTLRMPIGLAEPKKIWGVSADDVWIVGSYNLALWDGAEYSVVPISSLDEEPRAIAIWGSTRSDIWAVGADGFVGHYDGTEWTFEHRDADQHFSAIHGTEEAGIWVGGRREMLPSPSAGIVLRRE